MDRANLLRRMAAALHRAEVAERNWPAVPPTFARLPEWAQCRYIERARRALAVVDRATRIKPESTGDAK